MVAVVVGGVVGRGMMREGDEETDPEERKDAVHDSERDNHNNGNSV